MILAFKIKSPRKITFKKFSSRHWQVAVQEREQHPLLAVSVDIADLAVLAALVRAPVDVECCTNSAHPPVPVPLEATKAEASAAEKAGRAVVVVKPVAEEQLALFPLPVARAHPSGGRLVDRVAHWSQ